MKNGPPLKSTPFKKKPYVPGKHYGLKKTSSLQSYGTLRKVGRPTFSYKVKIGEKKVLIWFSARADSEFSRWIRNRDKKCLLCGGTEKLTNSHFHGRDNSLTRYHPLNCDTFCEPCHSLMEHEKNEGQQYYIFKLKQIGQEKFAQLAEMATKIISRETVIIDCMKFLLINNHKNNDI